MKHLLITLLSAFALTVSAATANRPNILFILTDDQNPDTLACFGGKVLTPTLDQLCREGVKFTRAYTSSSVCTPSRYTCMTGQYPPAMQQEINRKTLGRPAYHMDTSPNLQQLASNEHPGYWDADQLYDLQADPGERLNLARDPKHAQTVAELKSRLKEWLAGIPAAVWGVCAVRSFPAPHWPNRAAARAMSITSMSAAMTRRDFLRTSAAAALAGQTLADTSRPPLNQPDRTELRPAAIYSVPVETRSAVFTATIDGRPASVTHATRGYHCLSFDLAGPVEISITAPADDYWAKGIEVQPWRQNLRPALTQARRVAAFRLSKPAKLSITRPGDHGGDAEMLFIFANAPERNPPQPGQPRIRYYAPGVHHEDIDAQSGDFIYIAAGAVIFGSLNLWGVENVKVAGRGVIIHDGQQNPTRDEGWMHRKNWHAIVMDNARHIEIQGITCIVRSRTWMIQMQNSRDILFEDVKVIGGCPGDANVDGFDWLGGGDTIVRDCFIRAADDIFALYGNFDGYDDQNMRTPGLDVTNITIEKCVLSTSISNIVRTSFRKKVFNSAKFALRDSDILHGGIGACHVPFALLEIWADQGGAGRHVSYVFENIWLEYWYSLLQLHQSNPAIRDITFRNIWALSRPSMVASAISGDVAQVRLEHVNVAGTRVSSDKDLPLQIESGAQAPEYVSSQNTPLAAFTVAPAVIRPGEPVTLDAGTSSSKARIISYEWLFGDGTQATGKRVRHTFPDAEGTLRDGSGLFRVLLKVTDAEGRCDWACQPVIVSPSLHPAVTPATVSPGLNYRYYEGAFTRQTDFGSLPPVASGSASGLNRSVVRRSHDFGVIYEGYLRVPVDGAYLFLLLSRDGGRLEIDSQTVGTSPVPFPQRCRTEGNSVQGTWSVRAMKAGMHAFRVTEIHGKGSNAFSLKWQGPGFSLQDIPDSAFFRDSRQGS